MDSKLTSYQNKIIDDITSQENITLAHQIGAGKTINVLVIEPQKDNSNCDDSEDFER